MLFIESKITSTKRFLRAIGACLIMLSPLCAAQEPVPTVYVFGERPGWYTGFDLTLWISNETTMQQMRSLYEGMAIERAAAAKLAAEKLLSQDEQDKLKRERCERTAEAKQATCLRMAAEYKDHNNGPCRIMQSAIGNVPYGNPVGACFGRVQDQFDVYVATCNETRATNMLGCL